jgi:hypothetical protein
VNSWPAAIDDAVADWQRRVADAVEHAHDEDPNGPIVCLLCGSRYRGLVGGAAHADQVHGGAVPR